MKTTQQLLYSYALKLKTIKTCNHINFWNYLLKTDLIHIYIYTQSEFVVLGEGKWISLFVPKSPLKWNPVSYIIIGSLSNTPKHNIHWRSEILLLYWLRVWLLNLLLDGSSNPYLKIYMILSYAKDFPWKKWPKFTWFWKKKKFPDCQIFMISSSR